MVCILFPCQESLALISIVCFCPFRAADMPSERSEFAQPDAALVLTTISYYNDGKQLACVMN